MHEIHSGFLSAKTKEQALREVAQIKAELEEYGHYDYGGDCYYYDEICNTEEEAENLLGRGFGEGGICRVKDVSQSKSLTKLKAKLQELDQKERTYDEEFKAKVIEKFKERTSATCSCSECESRYKKEIALKYKLYCPVCRNWMVPDGVRDTYNKAKEKFRTMRAGLEKQIADQHKREAANTNKVRYYYYLDYHC